MMPRKSGGADQQLLMISPGRRRLKAEYGFRLEFGLIQWLFLKYFAEQECHPGLIGSSLSAMPNCI
jgi:hypothetical protein